MTAAVTAAVALALAVEPEGGMDSVGDLLLAPSPESCDREESGGAARFSAVGVASGLSRAPTESRGDRSAAITSAPPRENRSDGMERGASNAREREPAHAPAAAVAAAAEEEEAKEEQGPKDEADADAADVAAAGESESRIAASSGARRATEATLGGMRTASSSSSWV